MASSGGVSGGLVVRSRNALEERSTMDLNYVYHRHQVSIMRAGRASTPGARAVHEELARGYAAMIEEERTALKATIRGRSEDVETGAAS